MLSSNVVVLHTLASCCVAQNATKYLSQDPNYVDITADHKHVLGLDAICRRILYY